MEPSFLTRRHLGLQKYPSYDDDRLRRDLKASSNPKRLKHMDSYNTDISRYSIEDLLDERVQDAEQLLVDIGFCAAGNRNASDISMSRLPARFLMSESPLNGISLDTAARINPEVKATLDDQEKRNRCKKKSMSFKNLSQMTRLVNRMNTTVRNDRHIVPIDLISADTGQVYTTVLSPENARHRHKQGFYRNRDATPHERCLLTRDDDLLFPGNSTAGGACVDIPSRTSMETLVACGALPYRFLKHPTRRDNRPKIPKTTPMRTLGVVAAPVTATPLYPGATPLYAGAPASKHKHSIRDRWYKSKSFNKTLNSDILYEEQQQEVHKQKLMKSLNHSTMASFELEEIMSQDEDVVKVDRVKGNLQRESSEQSDSSGFADIVDCKLADLRLLKTIVSSEEISDSTADSHHHHHHHDGSILCDQYDIDTRPTLHLDDYVADCITSRGDDDDVIDNRWTLQRGGSTNHAYFTPTTTPTTTTPTALQIPYALQSLHRDLRNISPFTGSRIADLDNDDLEVVKMPTHSTPIPAASHEADSDVLIIGDMLSDVTVTDGPTSEAVNGGLLITDVTYPTAKDGIPLSTEALYSPAKDGIPLSTEAHDSSDYSSMSSHNYFQESIVEYKRILFELELKTVNRCLKAAAGTPSLEATSLGVTSVDERCISTSAYFHKQLSELQTLRHEISKELLTLEFSTSNCTFLHDSINDLMQEQEVHRRLLTFPDLSSPLSPFPPPHLPLPLPPGSSSTTAAGDSTPCPAPRCDALRPLFTKIQHFSLTLQNMRH